MKKTLASTIKMGWAETDMTPYGRRIKLEGQFYERISQSVETPITATAWAVESDGEQLVICSTDNTMVYRFWMDEVRKKVAEACPDLDVSKIICHATHTHNSFSPEPPDTMGATLDILATELGLTASLEGEGSILRDGLMTAREATDFLVEKVTDAIVRAWQGRRPGYFAPAFGRAAVGMCRRVVYQDGHAAMWGDAYRDDFFSLEGGNDNGMELLFTYDEKMKMNGVIVNLSCPSQVMEQRYEISSDYWGKVKILLRRKFGEDFKVLGLCSPAGDQCPRDLIRWIEPETPIEDPNIWRPNPPVHRADPSMFDVAGTWRIGRRIVGEILAILEEEELEPQGEAVLKHETLKLPLPLRRVSEKEYKEAKKVIDRFLVENKGKEVDYQTAARMHVHAGTLARYEVQQKESIVPSEVHVVRFGDLAFATNPFELFLDFANVIRARSKAAQTFLVQLSCDALGYLPTEKAEKGGHYSAYISSGYVGHEGGYMLAEETLKEIEKLFS